MGGIISLWWAASFRYGGRHHLVMMGGLDRNQHGISSGPVVAGVVGTRKFFYDVWGDAVNVAARMETTGVAGKIQISQDTYERLRDEFVLESRGEIEVKGKGMMPTWFLLTRESLAVVQPLPTQAGLNLPTNSPRTAV